MYVERWMTGIFRDTAGGSVGVLLGFSLESAGWPQCAQRLLNSLAYGLPEPLECWRIRFEMFRLASCVYFGECPGRSLQHTQ